MWSRQSTLQAILRYVEAGGIGNAYLHLPARRGALVDFLTWPLSSRYDAGLTIECTQSGFNYTTMAR